MILQEATCLETGLQLVYCKLCGTSRVEEIPALGHEFQDGVCTRCNTPDPDGGFDYDWMEEEDGYKITSYDGSVSALTIPSTYHDKPVIAIGEEAFFGNMTLKSVFIPASIRLIEKNAFYGCIHLEVMQFEVSDSWCKIESGSIITELEISSPLMNAYDYLVANNSDCYWKRFD